MELKEVNAIIYCCWGFVISTILSAVVSAIIGALSIIVSSKYIDIRDNVQTIILILIMVWLVMSILGAGIGIDIGRKVTEKRVYVTHKDLIHMWIAISFSIIYFCIISFFLFKYVKQLI